MTGGLDRHRCTEGETALRGEDESCLRGSCVCECVCDRQTERVRGAVLTPHLLCALCSLWQKAARLLIRQELRRDEAAECALVWRRLVHVFLKCDR